MSDAWSRKLAAPSREQLERVKQESTLRSGRVSMFVRGRERFSPEQIAQLKNAGATIRTNAGLVVTLDVDVQSVERLLSHDFVIASEFSSPLYPDKPR